MYELLILNVHRQYDAEASRADWIGVYLLAAFMDRNGHPSRAFAGYAHEAAELIESEMEFGVNVIGLSCDYENQTEVEELSREIKDQWHIPVIVGGPQSIALGEDFFARSKADVVVRGEGEIPLLALLNFYVDGTGKLDNIRGISFLDDGKLVRTVDQEPIMNLDALPFPDPKLILDSWFRRNTASFLTARGCPFQCAFCYEGGNTKIVRYRSVENVMSEVRQVLEEQPDIRYFLFTDDTFTLDIDRLEHYCRELVKLREMRDFAWFAEAHPLTLLKHPNILPRMLEAGLYTLQIGIESGSQKVLEAYNKKTTPKMLTEVVSLCMESGLPHLVGNIIVGGAFESEETIAVSKQFGLDLLEIGAGMLELSAINFWPFPGTAMTECPQKFGLEIIDPSSKTSVTDYPVVRSGSLSPEQISGLRADMERAFNDKIIAEARDLSESRAMRIYEYSRKYGVHLNRWYQAIYSMDRIRKFCALHCSGAFRYIREVPVAEINKWHPQRTCAPRVENGRRFGGDVELDAEMYRIFVASSGRVTVLEAAESCGVSPKEFLCRAEKLEEHMMLGLCRY
jgi:radical SAM superfamily enzyme YgiQ (UPF0313 family)